MEYYKIVDSIIGTIFIQWSFDNKPIIKRILLGFKKIKGNIKTCNEIENVAYLFQNYFKGEKVIFPINLLDFSFLTYFEKKVLLATYKIPYGEVRTYKHIAKLVGNPNASRAVGNALRKNPFPIIIPCHRVIKSDGSLGGFFSGLDIKKRLLDIEGNEKNFNSR